MNGLTEKEMNVENEIKERTVLMSSLVTNILINEDPEGFNQVVSGLAPNVYAADYMGINKASEQKIVHALLFQKVADAVMCTDKLNQFAKRTAGFRVAVYGKDIEDRHIEELKNGEFMFEAVFS